MLLAVMRAASCRAGHAGCGWPRKKALARAKVRSPAAYGRGAARFPKAYGDKDTGRFAVDSDGFIEFMRESK